MIIKPTYRRCKSNSNVVDHKTYWRCAFCDTKWAKGRQRKIGDFEKEK